MPTTSDMKATPPTDIEVIVPTTSDGEVTTSALTE